MMAIDFLTTNCGEIAPRGGDDDDDLLPAGDLK